MVLDRALGDEELFGDLAVGEPRATKAATSSSRRVRATSAWPAEGSSGAGVVSGSVSFFFGEGVLDSLLHPHSPTLHESLLPGCFRQSGARGLQIWLAQIPLSGICW